MRPIKISKKEWGSGVIGIALALGSMHPSDPWVSLPMLVLSLLSGCFLAYHHEGRLSRKITALVAYGLILVFVAFRSAWTSRGADSLVLSCQTLHSPVLIKSGTSIQVMDLVGNKIELGLSQVQPAKGDVFWPQPPMALIDEIYKCEISNYTAEALLNVEMTFTVHSREAVHNGQSTGSGRVLGTQSDKITIAFLSKEGQTTFGFYVHNSTQHFAEIHPPMNGHATLIRDGAKMEFKI